MRKILFDIQIADDFAYPEKNNFSNAHLCPVPVGEPENIHIDIEFEPSGGDVMREAEQALDKHIKEKYPNKDYMIYYWWWID